MIQSFNLSIRSTASDDAIPHHLRSPSSTYVHILLLVFFLLFPCVEAMATTKIHVPNGPDTKNGYTFLYVNIPLLAVAASIVCFRVWWRCFKNGLGPLNKADVCVVICLVSLGRELTYPTVNILLDIQYYPSNVYFDW